MDSGNSTGSLQSSSGADEEFDSRAESVSAFFNNPPPPANHVAPFPTTHIFDSLSNYLDPIQRSPSPLNLDMAWSKPGGSEPNPADLGGFINPSSSSPQNQGFFSTQLAGQTRVDAAASFVAPESASRGLLLSNDQIQTHNGGNGGNSGSANVARNPKKRSRASRRAPTTVLTTDTTNFRAMVQEFTGIPAPPFTSSSFPRTRLDLFGNSATASSIRSPPPPPYNLLRPFAHKPALPPHPHHPFLSSLPPFPSTVHNDITFPSDSSTNSSNSNFCQLSSDLGLLKQPLNMNTHNPLLNFPSTHHQLQPLPPPNSSILASKTQAQGSLETPSAAAAADNSNLKMGVLGDFGLNHVHGDTNVAGLQNMVSTSSKWAQRTGANNDGDGGVVRSVSGNFSNSERITNGKASYSDLHGDKGTEGLAARSEGMVESWINCSSD